MIKQSVVFGTVAPILLPTPNIADALNAELGFAGGLIHAAIGSAGGRGVPRPNRSDVARVCLLETRVPPLDDHPGAAVVHRLRRQKTDP